MGGEETGHCCVHWCSKGNPGGTFEQTHNYRSRGIQKVFIYTILNLYFFLHKFYILLIPHPTPQPLPIPAAPGIRVQAQH